jgi:excisionase family DNA binding protein
MVPDRPRGIPAWAAELGVSDNTIRGWVRQHDLKAENYGGRALIQRSSLRAFLRANPQLPAAVRALSKIDPQRSPILSPAAGNELGKLASRDDRDLIRELRARVATLDEELQSARIEVVRLREERDLWRARSRVHRRALRAQLDLEERADPSGNH